MAPPQKLRVKVANLPYYVCPSPVRSHFELEVASEPTQASSGEKKTSLGDRNLKNRTSEMAEPRVRLSRHQGQLNFGTECTLILFASSAFFLV